MTRDTARALWWLVLALVILVYALLARWAFAGDDDGRPLRVPDVPVMPARSTDVRYHAGP